MAQSSWPARVTHVQDGESVSAAIAGRPDRQLDARTEYLRNRLDAAETGENAILSERTVSEACKVGYAVYYNSATQQFEPALAQVELDSASGVLVPSASCDVVGVVVYKHNSTLADICVLGCVTVDLTEAVTGSIAAGRYYLSTQTAGKLERQRPGISVPVLYSFGDGKALVLPALRDFLEDHTHYKFSLSCVPAGDHTPPAEGERHVIDNADDSLPGWLPADHESFDGQAPPGAVFGYNLTQHPELSRIWPPVPVDSASLLLDRGVDRLGGTLVPLGSSGLAILDRNGLWWMSDCYGDVPWPTDYAGEDSTSIDPDSLSVVECPRVETMQLTLLFVAMAFATDKTVVTSLTAETGSPLSFVNCDGNPAATGDLVARMALAFLVDEETDAEGSLAFKELNGLTLKKGRLTEGLIAGANVTLTSTHSFQNDDDQQVHQGLVIVDVDTNIDQRELIPSITRLGAAVERSDADVPYTGFQASRVSTLRMRLNVPAAGMPSTPKARLRLTCIARSAGTFPDLSATYRRLPRTTTVASVPASDSALTIDTTKTVTADSYFDVDSDPVTVAAGDTLLLSLTRSTGDGYSGEIGIIRAVVIISAT